MKNSCPKGTSCMLQVESKATLRLSLWKTGFCSLSKRIMSNPSLHTGEQPIPHLSLSELTVQLLWFSHADWYMENSAISKWMKTTPPPPPPPQRINSFYLQTVLPPSSVKIRNKRKSHLLKKVSGRIKTKAFSSKIRGGGWHYLSKLVTFGLAASSAKAFSFPFGGTIT